MISLPKFLCDVSEGLFFLLNDFCFFPRRKVTRTTSLSSRFVIKIVIQRVSMRVLGIASKKMVTHQSFFGVFF